MLYLTDKTVIFALCVFSLLNKSIATTDILAVLGSVTVACLCQALMPNLEQKGLNARIKILKNFAEGSYSALCVFFPALLPFLPLTVYEAVRTMDILPIILGSISIVLAVFRNPFSAVYPLMICLLAALSCLKTLNNQKLWEKTKRSRDSGAELERVMNRRNRELRENLEYEVHITALNERNRIAREIHDNVGHLLSRSLLQTGALYTVCPKEQTDMRAAIEGLRDTLNSAMNSIRESVHGIRDDSLDLKTEGAKILAPLAGKFSVSFDYDIIEEIPPKIKLCFISIMKEAVSNIVRHSSGNKAAVTLREHPSLYQLIISDNGTTAAGGRITEGMGLNDMRERAESIGGNFRISFDKGFTVFVAIRKDI